MTTLDNLTNIMFVQISTSAEKKIIGVSNGVFQVEIDEKYLNEDVNKTQIEILLNQIDVFAFLDNQEKIFDLTIENLKGKFLKNAIETDIMGFSPFLFGFNFIVNQKVVDCLLNLKVDTSEYCIFEIHIEDAKNTYYLLFVPVIPTSEIIFEESRMFLEKDFLSAERRYLNIKSFGEYQEFTMKNPFVTFDKICLDKKHEQKDIISIQATNELFFSDRLKNKLNEENVSNLIESNRQVNLQFK